MENKNIPSRNDLQSKWNALQQKMQENNIPACLISSNVNLYYLTGTIFGGYFYCTQSGDPICFIKRNSPVRKDIPCISIRKPEDIPSILKEKGYEIPIRLMLEGDQLSYNEFIRLQTVFGSTEITANATSILRDLRKIKTAWEIDQFRYSAKRHIEVYGLIPSCYQSGISDIEFQANIERLARIHGSIGIFRGFGPNMEIHMGSVLSGDNAEAPSPYDFALGGEGLHPAAPIGANGTILKQGTSVMVDIAGNYTAYITDMTRTYSIGKLPEQAYYAHKISGIIQDEIIKISKPGISCADLYNLALQIVADAKLSEYFMGTKLQAKFIGHGVGIEINELPVLTVRSKDILQENMTFAIEPKFVLPEIGAVGNENTFLVTSDGLEQLTLFPEDIIELN